MKVPGAPVGEQQRSRNRIGAQTCRSQNRLSLYVMYVAVISRSRIFLAGPAGRYVTPLALGETGLKQQRYHRTWTEHERSVGKVKI